MIVIVFEVSSLSHRSFVEWFGMAIHDDKYLYYGDHEMPENIQR